MSGRPRFYLAIGIFYEPDRLRAAADSLLSWGFSPATLWQLTEGPREFAAQERRGGLQLRMLSVDLLAGGIDDLADGANLSSLCLNALKADHLDVDLRAHLARGATVVVAGTEGPDLHDQCVKMLLRYSVHTVHSQEVGLP